MSIRVKRVYADAVPDDGMRILVDRLWPRGIAKMKARIDLWLKAVAPSDGLRKRFHASPELWGMFCAAYAEELADPALAPALDTLRQHIKQGPVTLLYAARDEEHNNAVALKAWLEREARQ